jgi:RNA polymerase sigma-70 factor (ECF subfamily)
MDQGEDDLLIGLSMDLDPSFERLMLTYWHQLYAFVLRRVASQQDAEDIVSEAFVRSYLALKGYPAERVRSLKLRPWLYKITYHEYCRFLGRTTPPSVSLALVEMGMVVEQEEDQSNQPELIFVRAERSQELETLVEALPDRYREAVSLYYFEELSYQQIADLLDQPLGTIKSSVHRGISLLRKQLSAQSNEVF